ncbi:thiol:disulfide interchange protein DsbD [Natronospira proteinivora]|uniref:Thiol:disulfide interchange protein DsbD n=1 Tax=Natronospira proteinivora TaxID=1807133 RepID=A0ABT1GBF6_9GAMM|nr:protein-disulfide reductase DsbD [Natronospira proteinivora]MCP1728611.1 thiol:disulfide interchange protein DsbD [Natronospira proteinivora]
MRHSIPGLPSWLTALFFTVLLAPTLLGAQIVGEGQQSGDFGDTAGLSGGDFLHPDEAFVMSVHSPRDDLIQVEWNVAEEYYLYEHRFDFSIVDGEGNLGEARFPEGLLEEDEFFGESVVHRDHLVIEIPVEGAQAGEELLINVRYQGCADAGLCYPPMDQSSPVVMASGGVTASTSANGADDLALSEQDRLASLVADGQWWLIAALFFGFGLLLSFTPCVLPMVPILSSLIIGRGEQISTLRAFGLSLTYVLAMALTYTAAGVAAGLLGHNLQATLQHPVVLMTFALVFGLLAMAMFGFYQLQVPARFQEALNRLSNRQQAGRYTGVAIMGFLSALIVGPCVAAPLAGALLVIGQTGDALRGGVALFSMSMGMGVLLLVVGTSAGRLMPRTGAWMNAVKIAFGFLLLAVGVWMLERILPGPAALLLWSALLVMAGVYLGALDSLQSDSSGWRRFGKGSGLLLLTWGLVLLVAAAAGGQDPLRPLHGIALGGGESREANVPAFTEIDNQQGLDNTLAGAEEAPRDRPLMLEFYADWCVDCIRMERRTFTDPEVRAALDDFDLLKADVTRYTDEHRALLEHFDLFGPPAILFFDRHGEEMRGLRLVGEKGPQAFQDHLSRVQSEFDRD